MNGNRPLRPTRDECFIGGEAAGLRPLSQIYKTIGLTPKKGTVERRGLEIRDTADLEVRATGANKRRVCNVYRF